MVGENKNGFGIYYYLDHRFKYEGEFSNDSRIGRGIAVYMPN
jgi:hypothetical protein